MNIDSFNFGKTILFVAYVGLLLWCYLIYLFPFCFFGMCEVVKHEKKEVEYKKKKDL